MKQERPNAEFLPIQEAASYYEVDPSTLYRMISRGELTRHKRKGDNRTYLKVDELEEHLRPQPT